MTQKKTVFGEWYLENDLHKLISSPYVVGILCIFCYWPYKLDTRHTVCRLCRNGSLFPWVLICFVAVVSVYRIGFFFARSVYNLRVCMRREFFFCYLISAGQSLYNRIRMYADFRSTLYFAYCNIQFLNEHCGSFIVIYVEKF